MSVATDQLAALRQQLSDMQNGILLAHDFVKAAREHRALLQALPAKYNTVYDDLLDRLESGALFSEESCSFSQRDLHDSLQLWASKSEVSLAQTS